MPRRHNKPPRMRHVTYAVAELAASRVATVDFASFDADGTLQPEAAAAQVEIASLQPGHKPVSRSVLQVLHDQAAHRLNKLDSSLPLAMAGAE